MSDQAVQNIVSSAKTVFEIFKMILGNVLGDKAKEAEALKKKLDEMEKQNKTKDKEYNDAKKKLDSYEKTNLDFDKITKDTDKFLDDIGKDASLQKSLYDNYQKDFISELRNKGITKNELDAYKDLSVEKKGIIDECRKNALINSAEKTASDKGFDIPIKALKDRSKFQQNIANAMEKSKAYNISLNNDLAKAKEDFDRH
jgi:hypothetical protein